jgi:hypothetical protein
MSYESESLSEYFINTLIKGLYSNNADEYKVFLDSLD